MTKIYFLANFIIASLRNFTPVIAIIAFSIDAFTLPLKNLPGDRFNVDTTGISLFWDVVSKLKDDQVPRESEWNKLFDHPAYKQIQKSGNRCTLLRKYMPIVYMPSKKEELKSILEKESDFIKGLCRHLTAAGDHKQQLTDFLRKKDFSNWIDNAYQLAIKYLPDNINKDDFPTVYIILFENNGFGSPHIVLDLYRLYNEEEQANIRVIGHEAHHVFREKLLKTKDVDTKDENYQLHNGISSLQLEGMASMIDKYHWLQTPLHELKLERHEFLAAYHNSPRVFTTIDSLIQLVYDKKILPKEAGNIKSLLFWGGHANGMYMAAAIQKYKGRKFLAALTTSPYDFFFAYQAVAKKHTDLYIFSEKTELYIKELMKKYTNEQL